MEEIFDIEKWKKEYPVDYSKAINLLYMYDQPDAINIVFQELFSVFKMYIPEKLYKYYSFTDNLKLNDTKIQTLRDGKIYLTNPKDFNDPFDEKGYFYNADKIAEIERLKHVKGKIIDDFSSYVRSASLSSNDYNCMPMWAHYANNHNGYCVSYNMKDIKNNNLYACTFPVQYTNDRVNITNEIYKFTKETCELIDENMKKGVKNTVLTDIRIPLLISFLGNIKHVSWCYEKEFRCSVGVSQNNDIYIDAVPSEIYIGLKCKKEYRNELIDIAKQYKIPVYEMLYVEEIPQFMLKSIEIEY